MKTHLDEIRLRSDMFENPQMKRVIARFGWKGIGWYLFFITQVASSAGCKIDLSKPFVVPSIASKVGCTIEELRTFLSWLEGDFGLIRKVKGSTYAIESLDRQLFSAVKKRNRWRENKRRVRRS